MGLRRGVESTSELLGAPRIHELLFLYATRPMQDKCPIAFGEPATPRRMTRLPAAPGRCRVRGRAVSILASRPCAARTMPVWPATRSRARLGCEWLSSTKSNWPVEQRGDDGVATAELERLFATRRVFQVRDCCTKPKAALAAPGTMCRTGRGVPVSAASAGQVC